MPHEIRLAGPWEFSSDGESWDRCVLPFPANSSALPGDFRLRRKFHRPTGVERSVVCVVVSASGPLTAIQLNGNRIVAAEDENSDSTTTIFDVTNWMDTFNVVEMRTGNADGDPTRRIMVVTLRIAETD